MTVLGMARMVRAGSGRGVASVRRLRAEEGTMSATGAGLFDLSGRIALVTGSSRGIGFALARGLAQSGARVVLNARRGDVLDEAVSALRDDGLAADGHLFDVTDADAVETAIRGIEAEIGPIEILVNNAGIQQRTPLHEFPLDAWQRIMDTNLTSVFLVGAAVARRMIPRGHGKIINICSLTSDLGRQTIAPYAASKGGVKMLTRGMCADWARYGIQVNGLAPGYIVTEMNRALIDDAAFDSWVRARTPAGRWGETQELAGAAVFLSSSASDFVNGQVLIVDGGLASVI
jgi:gluconate 5-dehydrogenase